MVMKICLLLLLSSCEPEKCIEREDYYLSYLKHEYNILPKAGSRLGHKSLIKLNKSLGYC